MNSIILPRLLMVALFGVAFGFVEGAVVVYLRALYYPEGFTFPLAAGSLTHFGVELGREGATLIMLSAIGYLAGVRRWERFGYFLVAFGVWDIFYYVWLKVLIDWPNTLTDWDVLFLLPLPWIGPVIAAVAIAGVMIVLGVVLVYRLRRDLPFRPSRAAWALAIVGTVTLLVSFLSDTEATLRGGVPQRYHYELLGVGLFVGVLAFFLSCRAVSDQKVSPRGDDDDPSHRAS